jgi:phospholipase C
MGLRIPAVVVSPYARRGHVDHSTYGFESILKMIRYRYGLPPLTPRDLYANNIAAAFDFESPNFTPPALPQPPEIIATACSGSTPVDSGGTGVGIGGPIGSPPAAERDRRAHPAGRRRHETAPVPKRPKPHDIYSLVTSGLLERLHFDYKPATPATMFRHPSKLGLPR